MTAASRTVLVAGSSGLLGQHLVAQLRRRGDDVRRLVRRTPTAPDELGWEPDAGVLPADALDGVDAVVNLGGAGLGDHRWTPEYKDTIVRSRTAGTRLLAERAAELAAAGRRAPRLLQASAVGLYGDRGEELLTESAPPGDGFLADVVRAWEAAAEPARTAGTEVVLLRTGIVLSPTGGALGRLLPFVRLGVGGPLGDGRGWWPWITLVDHVRAMVHLLDSDLTGPVNLAAPGAARQGEVVRAIAHALHRPAAVHVPRLALQVAVGEFAAEILASQRQVPARLVADGFAFRHPDVTAAARWLAG